MFLKTPKISKVSWLNCSFGRPKTDQVGLPKNRTWKNAPPAPYSRSSTLCIFVKKQHLEMFQCNYFYHFERIMPYFWNNDVFRCFSSLILLQLLFKLSPDLSCAPCTFSQLLYEDKRCDYIRRWKEAMYARRIATY